MNRNLKYINDYATEKGIEINLSSNDLHRKESLAGTHESIRDKINFWEADTLSFMVANGKSLDVDLLISSDHLMHVEKTSVITILDIIRDDINPKYILLREIKQEFENLSHPRYFHNYDIFLTKYKVKYETSGSNNINGKCYFVRIYQRID